MRLLIINIKNLKKKSLALTFTVYYEQPVQVVLHRNFEIKAARPEGC